MLAPIIPEPVRTNSLMYVPETCLSVVLTEINNAMLSTNDRGT